VTAPAPPAPAVDLPRLLAELERLAGFTDAPPPAVTRVLWTPVDLAARAYVRGLLEAAGLALRADALGTLFARWEGSEPHLPAVATGSHVDAIPDAGRYDGTVGVLGALEALRLLRREGFRPRRSIELIVFNAEEPTRFGLSCLGSRAMCGALTPAAMLALRDGAGTTFAAARAAAGCAGPLESVRVAPGAYAAFVELHIEQGPELEARGVPIGAVTGIAAPATLRATLEGEGGHAGAVLMPRRRDALPGAAEIALAVERAARDSGSPDSVGTVGVFRVSPGAVNGIPARVLLEIDVRDVSLAVRDRVVAAIEAESRAAAARRGLRLTLETLNADPPASADPRLVETVEAAAAACALTSLRLPSRAYHDALFMARLCPTGMVFVPCRGGVSHRPDEHVAPEHLAGGVAVLARTLQRLAA
jgi:N-carbamoyl-L-amino-acid hydrolase